MIKALIANKGGTPTILLGITPANWAKLLAGDPILIGRRLGVGGVDVLIMAGEDEAAMVTDLEKAGLLPADVAEQMRAGYTLMEQVPATRADELTYRREQP